MPYQVLWRDPKTGEFKVSGIFRYYHEARRFTVELAKQGVEWWDIRYVRLPPGL